MDSNAYETLFARLLVVETTARFAAANAIAAFNPASQKAALDRLKNDVSIDLKGEPEAVERVRMLTEVGLAEAAERIEALAQTITVNFTTK